MKMKMKNPPHPGDIVGGNLVELGVTIKDAAEALGVTRQHFHKVISGRSGITPEMPVRLEMATGSTADTWLGLQIDFDLARSSRSAFKVRSLVLA